MRLFVGNLKFEATEDDIRQLFEKHGEVKDITIPTDRETGRVRGFGFVEMGSRQDGEAAMQALDGTELMGRRLNVNEAQNRGGRR